MSQSYQEALDAVNQARQGLEDAMLEAKEAHAANPNEETRAAKDAAVAELQAARAVERAGGRPLVVGDVFPGEPATDADGEAQ